jgi:hypothetical protein
VLISPVKWDILLKRNREDQIPDVAIHRNDGLRSRILVPEYEWETVCNLLRDPRLQNCFSSSASWINLCNSVLSYSTMDPLATFKKYYVVQFM